MKAKRQSSLRAARSIAAQAERIDRDLAAIRQAIRKPADARFAQAGLTVPQKALMRALITSSGLSLKELSHQLSLAHSTVSGIVDRLEQRGLVVRRSDSDDGRVTRIDPAPAVTEFMRTQFPSLSQGPLQAALQRARSGERDAIENALRRLRELLGEE